MNHHDDDSWDELLDRLARPDGPTADVERELQNAPADMPPLAADWVATAVAAATTASPRRRRRRWGRIVVPTVFALAACLYVIEVWRTPQNSWATMTLPLAVELLQRTDQPIEHRQSALFVVQDRAQVALHTLQQVRDELTAPIELRRAAAEHLLLLLQSLDLVPPAPAQLTGEDLGQLVQLATDPTATQESRLQWLRALANLGANALLLVREVAVAEPLLQEDCEVYLERLRRTLQS